MKLSKKVIALLLVALFGAQLVACGGNGGSSKDTENNSSTDFDYSAGLDENGFFENIKASDIVTLPEYKGLTIEKDLIVASEEKLQEQLDGVCSEAGSFEKILDREVTDGDTLNIDYVGKIDGVEFEGGNTEGQGTDVTIGVTKYIEGFLVQLIGHKPAETFDINVTFPEDYGKEELNGKDAVFTITINYIKGDYILTEEIAKGYGFETIDALKDDIREWLVNSARFYFFTDLIKKATCENIPEAVLDFMIDYDIANLEYNASMYGMTVEDFLAAQKYESKDKYIESKMETYKTDAILYLAAQAIAEAEEVFVSDKEVEESEYNQYVEEFGLPYIKQFILFQEKLPDLIVDLGVKAE